MRQFINDSADARIGDFIFGRFRIFGKFIFSTDLLSKVTWQAFNGGDFLGFAGFGLYRLESIKSITTEYHWQNLYLLAEVDRMSFTTPVFLKSFFFDRWNTYFNKI